MTYDIRARAHAIRVLAPKPRGKGQAVNLKTLSGGGYNPATSKVEGETEINQTGSGVVSEYAPLKRPEGFQVGDKELLLSPVRTSGVDLSPAPALGDVVTLADGSNHTIEMVAPLSPSGLVVMYTCNIRGAA